MIKSAQPSGAHTQVTVRLGTQSGALNKVVSLAGGSPVRVRLAA